MRAGRRFSPGLIMLACAGFAAACSSDDSSGPQLCQPTGALVCMTATSFNPANLTVAAGATVMWIDGSGIQHTVTSVSGSAEAFDQTVSGGSSFSRQFSTAGTFDYYCKIHGSPTSGMRGTITVN